jgi:23S rRNA (guanosine2251-2'-O)-methyltransferase
MLGGRPASMFVLRQHKRIHHCNYYHLGRRFLRAGSSTLFQVPSPVSFDPSSTPSQPASMDNNSDDDTSKRRKILSDSLQKIHIDAESLHVAAIESIRDATNGYDGRYGKSAIRTYRAFLYPNDVRSSSSDDRNLVAAAARCTRHIDFLLKRHKSHQAEFVRHHDLATTTPGVTFPLVLLLDNLRSAFNVGSLFRTADAAGCSLLITTGITPHPGGSGHEKLVKSALGAQHYVTSRHFSTTRDAVEFVRNNLPGYHLIGMETTEQSMCYADLDYQKVGATGIVLVLGNEVTGLDTEIMPMLDAMVEIPMFGTKNSLNVAACAPIVMYEILRQWNKSGSWNRNGAAQ